ncbi:MAG: hypothetical protein KA371_11685 [Acidobacteria bacterium]|nr:hypothetical protein [Acidobacteriota bacterium]
MKAETTDNRQVTAATERSRRMQVTTYASFAEHDRADVAYWQALPIDVRLLQVWRLSVEQWQLKGETPHESGLCRSVARLLRA